MPRKPSLSAYRKKRAFDETPEPYGTDTEHIASNTAAPVFVIQHHQARQDHYDFRLEIKGVLASWALPKGLTLNPAEKHLAIRTEDHPLEYARFEGVIPPDHYGAGTVMVWDIGTYKPLKIGRDRIEVWLEGTKVQGGFALIRSRTLSVNKKDDTKGWLLVKMDDEYAQRRGNPLNSKTKSALTNRTMAQIQKDSKA